MPFTDLEPTQMPKLDRDEEKGLILENGKRVISFRVATFQALVNRLRGMTGSQVAGTILFGLGNEIGQTAFRYSKDKVMSDNLVKVFDDIIRHRGWGRCLAIEKQADRSAYVFTMSECPLCYGQKATEAMCDLMRGIVTGWVEAFVNKKATKAVETECAAMGSKFCIFEATMQE